MKPMEIPRHGDYSMHGRPRAQIEHWLNRTGFSLLAFSFGPRDLFTYVVVAAERVRSRP